MTIEDRNKLVEQYLPLVRRIVAAVCRLGIPTYIEAEDLFQEAAARLPGDIERFRPGHASMGTYLQTSIRHDVFNIIRKERRRGAPVDVTLINPRRTAVGHGISPVALDFRAAKSRLTAEQHKAVLYCYHLGFTEKEAAESIGVSRRTLQYLKAGALAALKESMVR